MPVDLVPILQVADLALKTARSQIPILQAHKERCTLLLNRCQRLVDDVSSQYESEFAFQIQRNLGVLENVCISVRDTITDLAGKGLAWRLLHQEQMESSIATAESSLSDALFTFNVGAHVVHGEIQAEIVEATQRDHYQLISYLDGISQNDQRIIDALRASNLRLEETLMALMKHLQTRTSASRNEQASEAFIRKAVNALQKVSGGSASRMTIPPWQITTFEVSYGRNEEDCLGSGGFGRVFKGVWHGEVVAVKEMHEEMLSESRNDAQRKAFEKEIKIWLRLNHPRIVPFYGACLESTKPFLVSKYCPNGNVMDFIRERPEANRTLIFHQVSVGMMYLHSQLVIHADLKAGNILIGDDEKALICDFGLSQLKDQVITSQSNSRGIQGTLNYMAPEYLDGQPIDYPADVYSFAMTVWQIHTGLVPLSEIPRRSFHRAVVDKQERPDYPNSMSKPLWALIQQCWQHDAGGRPTFSELEASLQSLTEPSKASIHRRSLAASQLMSMFSRPPTSTSQRPSTPSGHFTGTPLAPVMPPILPPILPPGAASSVEDDEWFPMPAPAVNPPRSEAVFSSTLRVLCEPQSHDQLIHDTLLCYDNWLKNKSMNARGPRPSHVYKNRVKDSVEKFKKGLLFWIDQIPFLRGADITDPYRTLLIITGTCAMAEYTFQKNPEAPHLYVQEFIHNSMATSAFRAAVEKSVRQAYEQLHTDHIALGERLSKVVIQVYGIR